MTVENIEEVEFDLRFGRDVARYRAAFPASMAKYEDGYF